MRRLSMLMLLACLLSAPLSAQPVERLPFTSHAELNRFQRLTSQFGCVVCHEASLADSDTSLAHDLRHEVFQLMRAGSSDQRITRDLVERYSGVLLYQPSATPTVSLLWFVPIGALLVGATALVLADRRNDADVDPSGDAR